MPYLGCDHDPGTDAYFPTDNIVESCIGSASLDRPSIHLRLDSIIGRNDDAGTALLDKRSDMPLHADLV